MTKIKVTKSSVEAIPFTTSGQSIFRDTDLIGFGVCVGIRSKSYFAQREIQGRTVRVKIGSYDFMTAEEARREARQVLAKMERGEFVNRKPKNAVHTLSDALESYLKERKELRPSTVDTYRRVVRLYLPDWARLPLEHITRDMVVTKHALVGDTRGHSVANTTMRVFRAIYNYASAVNETLPPNPTARLSQTRSWYRERRRRGWVRPHQLRAWYDGAVECDEGNLRDFLTLLLFTGLRRSEAIGLRWEYIDLNDRTLTVPDTKNHEPLILPLSDFLHRLLAGRKETLNGSEWVFPGRVPGQHLVEPKKMIRRVRDVSGVHFTLHDLRRTFITIAESLDIPAYSLKRLINHKSGSDVTAGYIIIGVERLRRPMDKISEFLEAAISGDGNGKYY
jgi:integrase